MSSSRLEIKRSAVLEYTPSSRSGKVATIRVEALTDDGRRVTGYGETPIVRPQRADQQFTMLQRWATSIHRKRIDLESHEAAIAAIQRMLSNLPMRAQSETVASIVETNVRFSAQVALLDLTARGLRTTVANLLGAKGTRVRVAPRSLPIGARNAERRLPTEKQRPMRFALTGGWEEDLECLRRIATNYSKSPEWWLEIPSNFTLRQSKALIRELVPQMGLLFPSKIIVEQSVARGHKVLGELQRYAKKKTKKYVGRSLELVIMASGGISSPDIARKFIIDSGCQGINLKPPRIGGLIETRNLVSELLSYDPSLRIVISGTTGASPVITQSLHHLAAALPRHEYVTRSAPTPLAKQKSCGLGVAVDYRSLFESVDRYTTAPESAAPHYGGRPARAYPREDATRYLTKPAMRSHLMEREALIHGWSTVRYNPTAFAVKATDGKTLLFGASTRSPGSTAPAFTISDKHKGSAQAFLERARISVPTSRIFRSHDIESALKYAAQSGYPLVSKPVSGTGGAAVSVNIKGASDLRAGFDRVLASDRYRNEDVLLQDHVPGDVYRIMVSGDEIFSVVRRVPPFVVGDGQRTIAELILQKNVYRKANPRLRKGLIRYDRTVAYLESVGLGVEDVPDDGEHVGLAEDAYLNGGGESIDVLDETHPSILEEAIRAVKAVPGLNYCGVDILLEDHRVSVQSQQVGICELNSCPELITPQYPLYGSPRYAARRLLELSAQRNSTAVPSARKDELSLQLIITGRLESDYANWLVAHARRLGVYGVLVGRASGSFFARVSGPVIPVSVLVSLAGRAHGNSAPRSVETSHVSQVYNNPFYWVEKDFGATRGPAR